MEKVLNEKRSFVLQISTGKKQAAKTTKLQMQGNFFVEKNEWLKSWNQDPWEVEPGIIPRQ